MVGAGIGGSATAHFLRQHFGPEVQVDVFEKGEVGGRLATVTVNHHDYESGGSIIHSLNLHMQEFVKQLGACCIVKYTHTHMVFPLCQCLYCACLKIGCMYVTEIIWITKIYIVHTICTYLHMYPQLDFFGFMAFVQLNSIVLSWFMVEL